MQATGRVGLLAAAVLFGWAQGVGAEARGDQAPRRTSFNAASQDVSPDVELPGVEIATPALNQAAPDAAQAQEREPQTAGLIVYDFEAGTQDWQIPDWAKESEDDVGRVLSASEEFASHGRSSLQLLTDFPGGRWTGAYVEVLMPVTDWGQFGTVSVDVYLPSSAPAGLESRFILTVGEKWEWTEMNKGVVLEPGKWTTITAHLKPGSLDWKFFPDDTFRRDIRKLGVRVESNSKPVYSGPVYFDNIRLGQ
jgi:hypothetical protein